MALLENTQRHVTAGTPGGGAGGRGAEHGEGGDVGVSGAERSCTWTTGLRVSVFKSPQAGALRRLRALLHLPPHLEQGGREMTCGPVDL